MNKILSLVLVAFFAISIQVVNGETIDETMKRTDELLNNPMLKHLIALEKLINYCYDHASSPNPIKDLQDKGLLDPAFNNQSCLTIKQEYDRLRGNGTQ